MERYKGALTVTAKELRTYFTTPIAYIVITVFLAITGWLFFSTFFLYGQAEMRGFFELLPFAFSFVVPAVTMRLFSEEKNTGSFEIIMTLPVSTVEILSGKILAGTLFTVIMILPTIVYAISISFIGDMDPGPVFGGYFGAVLLGAAFSAIGVFSSSLTKNQIIAFIIGFAICLLLTLIGKFLFFLPSGMVNVIEYIGAEYHFMNIARGVIDLQDIVYFLSVMAVAGIATHYVLEERR